MSYPEESGQQRWYGDQHAYEPVPDQQPYAEPRRPEQPYAEQQPYPGRSYSGQLYAEPRRPEAGGELRPPEPHPSEPLGTGGQRHQAERIPLVTSPSWHADQPAGGGHGSGESPAYETPTTPTPAAGDSWNVAQTSRIPMMPQGQPPRPGPSPAKNQLGYPAEQIPQRRGPSEPVADGEGVYRSRRPAVGVALAIVAAVFALPALVLLGESVTAERTPASGVVAGTLMLLGLPAFAAGMYGLITGAGRAVERQGIRVLLRPPLSYLMIGVVLLLGAALAAR